MRRLLLSLLFVICQLPFSFAQQSANIVFIGNSITYGALHEQRELTAPPVQCARWLSQQEGIDTVYIKNCGRSGRTTYHFLPNTKDVIPAGDKTYFGDVVSKTRELVKTHPGLPLIFSIMLGTNDTVERTKNKHTEPGDYAMNLIAIIDSLLQLWPDAHVVLNKPTWYYPDYHTRGGSIATKKSLKLIDAYFNVFPQVIGKTKAGHVHIGDGEAYSYFEKHYKTDVFEEKDVRSKRYWLHPNEQGAKKLAEYWGKALLPVLKSLPRARKFTVNITPDGKSNMVAYLPEHPTGRAVVDCPGGGYSHLSMQNEGHDWAKWFNDQGIAFFVLTYRMPGGDRTIPISDAQQAIRTVRDSAAAWHVNPHDVGIMGFSAGGHLAATASTLYKDPLEPNPAMAAISARPDFSILVYPVITFTDEERCHKGSRKNLLGLEATLEDLRHFSPELQVTPETPPCILLQTADDAVHVGNSILYFMACRAQGVQAEMHLFPEGGHGYGLTQRGLAVDTWPQRLQEWTLRQK